MNSARADSTAELEQLRALVNRDLPLIRDRLATLDSPQIEPELRARLQASGDTLSARLDTMAETVAARLRLRDTRTLAGQALRDQIAVLTGLAQTTREMIHAVKAGAPLVKATTQEQHLLTLWRSCAPADQKLLLEIASRLGKAPL